MTEKQFAGKTWTKARFFSFLRSNLRKASVKWPPIQEVLRAHRRTNRSANKRLKWEHLCFGCLEWFPRKEVQVDHIVPCGSLNDWADLEPFCRRLFVEADGLAILCRECHKAKQT